MADDERVADVVVDVEEEGEVDVLGVVADGRAALRLGEDLPLFAGGEADVGTVVVFVR